MSAGERGSAINEVRNANHADDHEHEPRQVLLWRILTPASWLLVVITSLYYDFKRPRHTKYRSHTIWGQNSAHHTPFALNSVIGTIYWVVLYLIQIGYAYNLFRPTQYIGTAINLAPAFTLNNLLGFSFILVWTRSYFGWALFFVIVNWFNLTITYLRYPKTPKWQHAAVLAGPLAFTFISLYWVGAVVVNSHHIPGRIVANVFVWTWLVYGGFYIFTFKDWIFGFSLSILSAALGVGQFFTAVVALQWIFAFTIMAVLFIGSFVVAFPDAVGINVGRGQVVSPERERQPLLSGSEA